MQPASAKRRPLLLNPSRWTLFRQPSLPSVVRSFRDISGRAHEGQVCLTFDDGPDPQHTSLILDVLAEQRVRATFFVVGESAEQCPQLIDRILRDGHTLANHSYSHRHPWSVSSGEARAQVARATRVLERMTGSRPRWFRPPHGRLRPAMIQQARAEAQRTVLWTRSVIDWGPLGTTEGIGKRLSEVRAGDIVLMHDGARQHNHPQLTAQLLPAALDALLCRGITPITLDQAG